MTDIPPISVIQAQLGIGIKADSKNGGKCSALTTAFSPIFLNQRPKIERSALCQFQVDRS